MPNKFNFKFILILSLILSGCVAETGTASPTTVVEATIAPSASPVPMSTDIPVSTPTSAPVETSTPVGTSGPVTSAVFPVGPGGADVIPHQIVRTNTDHLYIFSSSQGSKVLRTYRTLNPGFPNGASDFAPAIEFTETRDIMSVDAVYDGKEFIHVIINTLAGEVKDYPFDTTTNSYKPAITLANDSGVIDSGLYIGTSGVSGMVDLNGNIHLAYWKNDDHILHRAYTYDGTANSLTPLGDFVQVDTAGKANHPVLVVSPADNTVTVAWISESDNPTLIRARTRTVAGDWGDVEIASTFQFPSGVSVWTSKDNGLNIDQGPSLLIDSSGVKYMVYIESFNGAIGDYGRSHYVMNNGSGWVDTALDFLTHDPALALNASGEIYIIGHGHHRNPAAEEPCYSMDTMCYVKMNVDGKWGIPTSLIQKTDQGSFDSSPSVKWSAVGFNRPEVTEFIFFMTPYDNPTVYYARLP
ncbi:MAG: hypothetical protein IPP66_05760 [Anaerolineales bacterium]|nr:hypothetical protein [Anaerolineales bacterium]